MECIADKFKIQGFYDLPATTADWESCVPDPSYIPGCKSFMWPTPKGMSLNLYCKFKDTFLMC